MSRKSIKKEIFIIVSLMIFVIVAFSCILLIYINKERDSIYNKSEINYIRVKVKPAMDMIKEVVSSSGDKNKIKSDLANELKSENSGLNVIDNNGNILYNYNSPEVNREPLDESIYMDNSFIADNKKLYKIAFPVVENQKQLGNAVFYLNYDEVYGSRKSYESSIKIIVFCEIAVLLFLITLLLIILKTRVFSPISNLKRVADRINKGDYNFEIVHSEGEVGKFAGAFELMRDEINENVKIQKKMDESRKNLIAAISHDIRTPVATISAYVEAINSGVANDEKKLKKYLDIIYNKCGEIKKLTEDLFIHSQIDAEKLSINKEEVYFDKFVQDLLEPVIIEVRNSGMNFEIKSEIPDTIVNIDTRRIGQVFLNIIENSKKYRREDGTISMFFTTKDDCIEVEIEDNGIGIKPYDMPYVFDKFYRGEKSRNKAYGGAGLGLAICKSIIEAHGGRIWIESIDGAGTKVFFTIMK